MQGAILEVCAHGACQVTSKGGVDLRRPSKLLALIIMLATSEDGWKSRATIQSTLWGNSGKHHGRASLRQTVRQLRQVFGDEFDDLFDVDANGLRLHLEKVDVTSNAQSGAFLEGFEFGEPGFAEYLEAIRAARPAVVSGIRSQGLSDDFDMLQPAVVILPFQAIDPIGNTGAFGDLLAEQMTRFLSQVSQIDVVNHLSARQISMTKALDTPVLRDAMGVAYAVTGTIRVHGNAFTLNVDFSDLHAERTRWSQEISGSITDFLSGSLDVLHELTGQIVAAIIRSEVAMSAKGTLGEISSHATLITAVQEMHRGTYDGFASARKRLTHLMERHQGSALVRSWMVKLYLLMETQGIVTDLDGFRNKATRLAEEAVSLDPHCSFSLTMDGFTKGHGQRAFDQAAERYRQATLIDPNCSLGWLLRGAVEAFQGEGDKAVEFANRASRLSPMDPAGYFYDCLCATACLSADQYDRALTLIDRSLEANARHTSSYRVKAIAEMALGCGDAARGTVQALLEREPGFTIERYKASHPASEHRTGTEWARLLAEAGAPMS